MPAQASFILTRPHVRSIAGQARLLARPANARGRTFVVVVAASLDDRNESLRNLRTILLIGGPVALLLASLAGYAVSGTGAAASRSDASARRRISAAEPDQRLPLPDANDELHRLGETLNQMLGRLEAALERERTFVDDASHELRTPLAMHKTELELALRYAKTPEEMRAAIASAIVEVDRLSALAEDLLVLARSEQGKLALHLRRVRLADLLGDVRERFASRIDGSGRTLVVEPTNGLTIDADPVRLEQALTNLVENAIQHGGGEITVRASESDGDLQIHVEDRAPASRRSSSTAPSSASAAPIRRVVATAPGWAWRSWRRSPAPTGGRPTPPTGMGAARTSGSSCRRSRADRFHGRFIASP